MPGEKKIETICVCGAGTMGSGIAQVVAQAGFKTIQFDVNKVMLDRSKNSISRSLQKFEEKGKITSTESVAIINSIYFTEVIQECKADLIIEAIVEIKEAKIELLNNLAAINNSNTIFATNTSSIAVTEIASATSVANRVAGLHFFNPVQVMKLVEVVQTEFTDQDVLETLTELVRKMNKTPVVCNDSPGFIVNRVARNFYLEAMLLLEKGLCSVETIDSVLEASGFKMGPFKLMDMIGMDINYQVSTIVWDALGRPERLKPAQIQKEKVDRNELGRKTGKGFYDYPATPET